MNTDSPEHSRRQSLLQRISSARADLEAVEDELRSLPPLSGNHDAAEIDPVSLARGIYAARRARDRMFDPEMFADPAWDLLLDLYASHFERRLVSTSSACIAAAVPATTALRWIEKMEVAGLLFRRPVPDDQRKSHLELTPEALDRMTDLLVRLGSTLRY